MKLVELTCPHCGAKLNVDVDDLEATCEYCGSKLLVDDEDDDVYIHYEDMEQAGYEFEKGRQKAMKEHGRRKKDSYQKEYIDEYNTPYSNPPDRKERNILLKIIIWFIWFNGWVIMFPIPFTVLLYRDRKHDRNLKYLLLVASWVLYFGILILFGN